MDQKGPRGKEQGKGRSGEYSSTLDDSVEVAEIVGIPKSGAS